MTDRRQAIREPGVESGPPQPRDADTPAQFVAVMRQLRQWAHLSYRELEKRAEAVGEVLPRATLAGVLNRQELPREELLAAFVRACGGDEPAVQAWVRARKNLAVERERPTPEPAPAPGPDLVPEADPDPEPEAESAPEAGFHGVPAEAHAGAGSTDTAPDTAPDTTPEAEKPAPRRLRRPNLVLTAGAVLLLLAAAVTGVTLLPDDGTGEPHMTPTGEPAVTTTPSETSGPAPDRAPPAEAVPDDKPARSKAPHTTPSTSTAPAKVTPSPAPERTTAEPSWPEQGQGPTAYEPPPQPSTSSPAQSQDPFPEETCWDVTDGCV
ncbi:hypothetical protein ACFVWX_23245 [Streptomyces sp. NPDC058220]|uniref:hypothetical protein n=1 Tax=Streptomyces sp. NPDC058220 TaxID=3346387 RepID=UPI0036EE2AF3